MPVRLRRRGGRRGRGPRWSRRRRFAVGLAIGALVPLLVVAAVGPGRTRAQTRAVVVLATTLDVPVVSSLVNAATPAPLVEDTRVAGVPTTVVRPEGEGPFPALLFVNGATPEGRRQPQVARLARAFARAGFVAAVPDVPGLATGTITPATLDATAAVARSIAERPDVEGGRVGLVSVSVGASLALVTAADPTVRDRVTVVAGIAPFADAREAVRLASTDHFRHAGRLVDYDPDPYLRLVILRSLLAMLPASEERDRLTTELAPIEDDKAGAGLARVLPRWRRPADPGVRGVLDLYGGVAPPAFDERYARLPERVRSGVARLSPLAVVDRVRAPVELATPPRDKYFPVEHSQALAAGAPSGRVTVTTTLDHAIPELSVDDLRGLARLDAFIVRSLEHADP